MLVEQLKVKLTLLPLCPHLAEIHHPQRLQRTINSERCPWVSMDPLAPIGNGLELGLRLDLSTSWRCCPLQALSTAKFRWPHWLHTHKPRMAKVPQAGRLWPRLWLWKRWCRTSLNSPPLFTVSWPPSPSPDAHPFPYQRHSRGRTTELWQTTEFIDNLLLVTYFSSEMKLTWSVGGEVHLLLKFLGAVC